MADIEVITIKNNNYLLYDKTANNMRKSAVSEYKQAINNLDYYLDEDYTYLGIYNDDINVLENRLEALENNVANLLEDMMYENQYLTIERVTGRNPSIKWPKTTTTSNHKTIYYSRNKSTWYEIKSDIINNISFSGSNKIIYLKGTNDSYYDNSNGSLGITVSVAGTFKVYGNIMSLFYGDNFKGQTAFPNSNAKNILDCFFGDDNNSTNYLIDASNLILPATTLTPDCYGGMFMKCTELINAPELPATTLADLCYADMFNGCTSLVNAPKLPATVLTDSCYMEMFKNCTSLTTAPKLSATVLAESCYFSMFNGCTKLTTAPELPATTLVNYCYEEMFEECTSLTTAPELPATTLAEGCYSNMFQHCASLTTAPSILPATTLVDSCYHSMFGNCTSLEEAPILYGAILAPYCYRSMFFDCNSLNYIKYYGNLLSYTNTDNQFFSWVNNVATSGIFENPNNINFPRDENGVPASWSLINPWAGLTIECTKGPLQLDWGMTSYVVGGAKTIQYSTDNINWTSISSYNDNVSYSDGTSLHGRFPILNTGDKLYLKGNNSWYHYYYNDNDLWSSTSSKIIQPSQVLSNNELISNDGKFNIYGNIMSLINSTNFSNLTVLPNNPDDYEYTFNELFANTNVVNASGLMLPATTLMTGCYYGMFEGCTLLTAAPELPATTLTFDCYHGMFKNCTSLTTAPELRANNISDAADCYHDMFYNCTSLNYVKYSGTAEWTIFNSEFINWLYNVAYNGTFVNPNNIYFPHDSYGGSGIPPSWTIITS